MTKVMLVEDSSVQRMAIKGMLESNSYEVKDFENFDMALDHLSNTPDIFLLDIETNCNSTIFDFINSIKKHGISSPIIVLSIRIKKDVEEKLKNLGVEIILWKPIGQEELHNSLQRALK